MKPVVCIKSDIKNPYYEDNFFTKIKDRFNIYLEKNNFVEELNLKILSVNIPSNFNKCAYYRNISSVKKISQNDYSILAPKTYRILDYNLFTDFQKKIFAYSVMKSAQFILRLRNKSIKNSCIVFYEAADNIMDEIISEFSKVAKYIILLSKDLKKTSKISDYIISDYGVTPIIMNDDKYALNEADFIVSSRSLDLIQRQNVLKDVPVWYLDNMVNLSNSLGTSINDVIYFTPWNNGEFEITPELLGAILNQMEEKDVEKSLIYNGIYLDKIMYNNQIVKIQ